MRSFVPLKNIRIFRTLLYGIGPFLSGLLVVLVLYKLTIIYSVDSALTVVIRDFQTSGIQQIVSQLKSNLETNPFIEFEEVVICSASGSSPMATDSAKIPVEICRRVNSLYPNRYNKSILQFDSELYVVVSASSNNVKFWGISLGLIFALLFNIFRFLIRRSKEKELRRVRAETASQISAQIGHDIRSPISSLNLILQSQNFKSDESVRLMKISVQRISEIAELLLEIRPSRNFGPIDRINATSNTLPDFVHRLIGITDAIHLLQDRVSQAGIRFLSTFNCDAQEILIRIPPPELARLLEIIVSNSIEAAVSGGFISLNVERDGDSLILELRDSGKGIPPEVLENLGKGEITFGKSKGNGMGLMHVFQTAKKYDIRFVLKSEVDRGTTASLRMDCLISPVKLT